MFEEDIQEEREKREEFKNILLDLAKSEDLLQDRTKRRLMYKRLESLYDSPEENKGFRHFYSDIFLILTEIKKQPEKLGSIDILGQNLSYLREHYQAINCADDGRSIDISSSLKKLLDHVSLDMARIEYSDAGDWRISQEEHIAGLSNQVALLKEKNVEAKRQVERLQSENIEAQKKQEQLKNKIVNQQKEYIAILGIFAAVVLAFNADLVYSSSVFQHMAGVSIYRLIAVSLVIGLVTVSILSLLFYFIDRIVNSNKEKIPIFFIVVTAAICALLMATIVFWLKGTVEKRNADINVTLETTD